MPPDPRGIRLAPIEGVENVRDQTQQGYLDFPLATTGEAAAFASEYAGGAA
jgi:hypothetical protein